MIRAKKSLGQHFLNDPGIAKRIVDYFIQHKPTDLILEVGPGTGALTAYLIQHQNTGYHAVEIDERAVEFLEGRFPGIRSKIFQSDFLDFDLTRLNAPVSVIGNFPYNISSQILFHILKYRQLVPFMLGMFQHEVAQRLASGHGNKVYGILSIFMQAFYDVEILFVVTPGSFQPAPKVKSAVVSFRKKPDQPEILNEQLFFEVVKTAFGQRRKILRNSLKKFSGIEFPAIKNFWSLRAEQISPAQWIEFANIAASIKDD